MSETPKCKVCSKPMIPLDEAEGRWYCYEDDLLFRAKEQAWVTGRPKASGQSVIQSRNLLGTDRDFTIQKVQWSLYEVAHPRVKGTLRILGIPANILEFPRELLPPNVQPPCLGLITQPIVGFRNLGSKDASDMRPVTFEEYTKSQKEDITSFTTPRDEPWNEFVVGGSPAFLIRTRTVLLKLELLKDRRNQLGDPFLWPTHQTSHSVSEYKTWELSAR